MISTNEENVIWKKNFQKNDYGQSFGGEFTTINNIAKKKI
jgi:hypothetical protein